ncbi:RNA-binding protein Musashi Rbp6-like isoform X5 [Vespula maculifrons]|uniref:RNA-binding protein Musashi Rbp6-like isoform X5 n=1 Tax=Vespula maculifrons TaxID=7453 RepID=A0ABD2C7Y0_VESMC
MTSSTSSHVSWMILRKPEEHSSAMSEEGVTNKCTIGEDGNMGITLTFDILILCNGGSAVLLIKVLWSPDRTAIQFCERWQSYKIKFVFAIVKVFVSEDFCLLIFTEQVRGFGFITFADPASVDKVLTQGNHELDGKKATGKASVFRKINGSSQKSDFANRCGSASLYLVGTMISQRAA